MRTPADLFPYQRAAVEAALAKPRLALFMEPGLGKTAVALTALAQRAAWPALVLAPASVAEAVWPEEAAAWSHLSGLQVTPIVGSPAKRRALLDGLNHVEVVSYDNLKWLTDHVDVEERYAAVVFDELSKMKYPGTARFRRFRARGKGVPIRLGLTGTPVGNHLLDVWGEMFMVAGAEPLGPRFVDFQAQFFEAKDYWGRDWQPRLGAEEAIARAVAPFCHSFEAPPGARCELRVNEVAAPMPPSAAALCKALERELWAKLPSGAELEALAASAAAVKLRQIAGGAVYLGQPAKVDGEFVAAPGPWEEVHGAKLAALDEILDELQGEPAIVYYWFQHERARLERLLKGRRRWAHLDGAAEVRLWNERRLEVLLAHPQSGGYGLNLQAGGHTAIWFALPWSHELWTQANARLARTGQAAPYVMAHALISGPADAKVLAALRRKAGQEAAFLEAVR